MRVTAIGEADLIGAGDVIHSVTGVLDDDNLVDEAKTDKLMDKLGLSYVFCAGVSKDEFKSVCYAVRYIPDSVVEKNVPFNRLVSKNCLIWYILRHNVTRDERNLVLEGDNKCLKCNRVNRRKNIHSESLSVYNNINNNNILLIVLLVHSIYKQIN